MNKKTGRIITILLTIVLFTGLSACSDKQVYSNEDDSSSKKTIRVGVSAGPYNVLFADAIQPILEDWGYTIENIEFQDLLQSNIALNNNEVDVNVAQHQAWIDSFNAEQNGRMTAITQIPTVPAGIFSSLYSSLDEITEGAKIAIPDDASNTARAYALLQKANWITLKDNVSLMDASASDIVDNPYNLEFVEMSSLNIPRSLQDFDFAVITGSIVYNAKIDPSTALLQEDMLPHLVLVAAVNKENVDTTWAKDIVRAYESDEFKEYLIEKNQDNFWLVPDSLK